MGHEAYGGLTRDHLYRTCPALQRTRRDPEWIGQRLIGGVDPEGTDVCGWCYRKWKGQQR